MKAKHIKSRVYGLDILRAVAILLVVTKHSVIVTGTQVDIYDGVGMFFVLSGFLIGKILLKTIDSTSTVKDLGQFWFRRWMRTLPAYLVALTLLIVFTELSGHSVYGIPYYLTFTQSMFRLPIFFQESWSLCVEEWFYLLTPIALFVSLKLFSKKSAVLIVAVISIITILAFRIYATSKIAPSDALQFRDEIKGVTFYRMDAIMFGIVAAWCSYYNVWKRIDLLFGLGLVLIISLCFAPHNGIGFFCRYCRIPLESIAIFLILPKLANIKYGKGIIYRFLTFTSIISYSLYLLHCALTTKIIQELNIENAGMRLFLYLVMSFSFAYILYRTVEKPFMDLRDRRKAAPALSKIKKLEPVNYPG